MRVLALLLIVAFLAAGDTLWAEPPVPMVGELKLGEHWYGREITLADLEGKVVLFVLWGS